MYYIKVFVFPIQRKSINLKIY